MIRSLSKKIVIAFGAVTLLLVPYAFSYALTISPARVEIAGDPGQTLVGDYLLINEQNEQKTFYSNFENFEAQGETGAPNFVVAKEGLATWIDSPAQIVLEPKESVKLKYTITIPDDAEPGGHFAAIFWGTTNPDRAQGSEQVMLGAKIGVLVLLRVNGDVEEGGGITEFIGKDEKRFYTMIPVDLEYKFKNTGADRIKPKGEIAIKNTFGITTSVINANPQEGNILPQSTRKYSVVWNGVDDSDSKPDKQLELPTGFFSSVVYQLKHFALGLYIADLDVAYGADEDLTDSSSFVFFVFPWQLLVVAVVVVLILRRGLKSYNKMIVKRAQGVSGSSGKKEDVSTTSDD